MPSPRSRKLKPDATTEPGKLKLWRETELEVVRAALIKSQGDKVIAAALLGIGQTTIYRKLEEFAFRKGKGRPRVA